ncbi:hypothetical protein [Neisseria blantyrii]|uniref:hypothetical protein n=1 Tax=Neisseria blantyrii TaxID=2830647 RepID=UPI00272D1727|nr:hypothetical protein [Neisseria blantyrii]
MVGAAGGSLNGTSGTNTNALFNAQVGGVLGQNAVENNGVNASQAGTTSGFIEFFNNTTTKMGQQTGKTENQKRTLKSAIPEQTGIQSVRFPFFLNFR